MRSRPMLLAWLACVSVVAEARIAEGRALSLSEAVGLALQRSSRAMFAQREVSAAQAEHKSNRGKLGPSIDLEAAINVWDSPYRVPFDAEADPVTVRDQLTAQTTVSARQPLTVQLIKGYELSGRQRDIAVYRERQAARDIACDAAVAYLRLKQAGAGVEIARAAVAQGEAQLRQGQALHAAGVIDKNDLLKLEVARAQAQAQLIRARGGRSIAQTRLALALSLPPETVIDPSERFREPQPGRPHFARLVARALGARAEIQIARARAELASGVATLAFWNMLPTIAAVASYQNIQGQVFAQKNAFFVGGVLQWNIWQWGASYYEYKRAEHLQGAAQSAIEQLEEGIVLALKQNLEQLDVARETLGVAKKAENQAEEAYRIEQVKYENGASTTTDLIDAQLVLNRARLLVSDALYDWYTARVELARASDEALPWSDTRALSAPPGARAPSGSD